MKSDEEIGLAIRRAGPFAALWSPAFASKIGAAARKAVGEPPRMMIQGMSVDNLINVFVVAIMDPKRPCDSIYGESIYVTCAKEAYRLANTPADPEPDPDALAKEAVEAFRNSGGHDYPTWSAMDEGERDGWRAVAKFLEEKK